MNNKPATGNRQSKILIVGAGPAGASLAIRLARKGFRVVLLEREKFPRQKLCGEFVSPECLAHFEELGVLEEMLAVGGDRIAETVFFAPNGKSVSVLSEWFGAGSAGGALSISRAAMDFILLEKARDAGVRVLEETQAAALLLEKGKVSGVRARTSGGETLEFDAELTVDATGRAGVLGKLLTKTGNRKPKTEDRKPKFIGFKAHLENVGLEKGVCEIYFFRGGYGGLSHVENGRANHCFLIEAETAREFQSDIGRILENVVFRNERARETLRGANAVTDWLAVSVDRFGAKDLVPAPNLFSVGDAAAFIDPFTGSGMLMALESAGILTRSISENFFSFENTARQYESLHRRNFRRRLLVCNIMRRAAFAPRLAGWLISGLSLSGGTRELIARATRPKVTH